MNAPAIIPSSCSTSSVIWNAARFSPGNVHSADGWQALLAPVVTRYRGKVSRLYFRADAGFASPDLYEFLEGEGIKYAIRIPTNRVLQDRIGYLLKRPVGRRPNHVRRFSRGGGAPHSGQRRSGEPLPRAAGIIIHHRKVVAPDCRPPGHPSHRPSGRRR